MSEISAIKTYMYTQLGNGTEWAATSLDQVVRERFFKDTFGQRPKSKPREDPWLRVSQTEEPEGQWQERGQRAGQGGPGREGAL